MATSSSTKELEAEINLPIIKIYMEKVTEMEETSRKNSSRWGYKVPARCVWDKKHLQNAFTCFPISFVVLVLLSHLVVCSFPSFSGLCLLECMHLPVSALILKQNYSPWGSGVIAIENNFQHKRRTHPLPMYICKNYWYKQLSNILKVSQFFIVFPSLLVL